MDINKLLSRLKEKDELIIELKKAFLVKDERIAELESSLNALANSSNASSSRRDALPPGFELLRLDRSKGLFSNGLLARETELAFENSHSSQEIELSFLVPHGEGGGSERLQVRSNFWEPSDIEIPPGQSVVESFRIPEHSSGDLILWVISKSNERTSERPHNSGVYLIKIGVR